MNKEQEHLLQLLKEIDAICRKHNIPYYAAGGTVIGAARHKGFIPWDDDIDLYMTRDNFEKFRQAFKQESPANRKLEFIDDNEQYCSLIPRYHNENSTHICRYHIYGNMSGGLLIDILIMDNFPNDTQLRREYLAKLNVYSELIVVPYGYSHKNRVEFLDMYDTYRQKVEQQGREDVLREIESELFFYPEEECDDYVLCWASVPVVLSKKMMGTPIYLEFEDMMVPVPEDWYGYLTQLYGTDWMNVPRYEGQETHITLSSMDYPYQIMVSERNRYILQKKATKLYAKRKLQSHAVQFVRRPIENFLLTLKSNIVQKTYRETDAVIKLYQQKKYVDIVAMYQQYVELQSLPIFSGAPKHGYWQRWHDPWIVPIKKEILEILLLSLMKNGDERTAEKLINIYNRAEKNNCISDSVIQLSEKITRTKKYYYLGDYAACLKEFDEGELDEFPSVKQYRHLAQAKKNPSAILAEELKEKVSAEPLDMNLLKAYGDVLYEVGYHREAEKSYEKVLEQSRNGIFWRDIQKKTGLTPALLNEPTPYTPSSIENKEKILIDEIVDICKENGIKYMFSRGVAKQLLYAGNFGYANTVKTIYMDAKNAAKFLEVVKKNPRSDRKVFSWENNRRLRDFKLVYSDVNSVYASLDRVDEWIGIGIHVDIIILRTAYASKKLEKLSAVKEIILNVAGLTPTDMGAVSSKKRKLAHFLICSVFFKVIKPDVYARWLFRSIMRREMRATPVRYFFRKNKVKGLYHDYFVSADQYNTLTEILIDDKSYAISEIDKLFLEKVKKYDEEPISNVPPKESLFLLVRDELTWDELEGMIDREAYNELDWSELRIRQKKLTKTNEKIKNMWVLMNRGKDKADFILEYLNLQEKITFNGYPYKYSDMDALMESYDYKVRFYWEKKMTFFATPALTTQYIAFLHEAGRADFAKKLKVKEKTEKYLLEKDLLLEKLREIYGLCK